MNFVLNILEPWFGDPHIVTSDGVSYTFNGLGEYLFTEIGSRVTIQARTERVVLDSGGKVDFNWTVTYLTTFTFQFTFQIYMIVLLP